MADVLFFAEDCAIIFGIWQKHEIFLQEPDQLIVVFNLQN
jgi:hypothetical protein